MSNKTPDNEQHQEGRNTEFTGRFSLNTTTGYTTRYLLLATAVPPIYSDKERTMKIEKWKPKRPNGSNMRTLEENDNLT